MKQGVVARPPLMYEIVCVCAHNRLTLVMTFLDWRGRVAEPSESVWQDRTTGYYFFVSLASFKQDGDSKMVLRYECDAFGAIWLSTVIERDRYM